MSITYKRVSVSSLEGLLKLSENKSCYYKDIPDNKVIKELEKTGAISVLGKPKIIFLNSEEAVINYLKKSNKFIADDIKTLKETIIELKNGNIVSKTDIAKHFETTKDKNSKSFYGIHINVLNPVNVYKPQQNGKKEIFTLNPISNGSYFFFYKNIIEIPDDTIVVGVENPEVLFELHLYNKKYFNFNSEKAVFILIKDNLTKYFYKWISNYNGKYIHWGDYDIAGIAIFLYEIYPKLKRKDLAEIFIPEWVYKAIPEIGNNKHYNTHMRKFDINKLLELLPKKYTNAKKLLGTIQKYKKSLEQEKEIYYMDNIRNRGYRE